MIQLIDLQKSYKVNGKQIPALNNINLTINKGEIFGVIGHSGAGKSTLIRCINLLEKPSSGQVSIDGVDLTKLNDKELQKERRKIGMIFQHFNLLSSLTIRENVAFPLRLAKRPKEEINQKVNELLSLVGLEDHADKFPNQLSGGQKQRVGIARALANDPKVLLCDEATSALDPQTTNSILGLLRDINKKLGLTIVLITHEMQVIRSTCDKVAVIDGGDIVELGNVIDVFLKPNKEVTRQFVEQVNDSSELKEITNREASKNKTVIRISFLGEETYQPILSNIIKETNTTFIILQGTISRMKDIPYGQLVVELEGEENEIKQTIEMLGNMGLEVEVM